MTDYTNGQPYLVTRTVTLAAGRLQVHLLLPDGTRRATVMEDGPTLDADIAKVADAYTNNRRLVMGRLIGGP